MQIGTPIERDDGSEAVRLCESSETKSDGRVNIRRGKLTVVFPVEDLLPKDMERGAQACGKAGEERVTYRIRQIREKSLCEISIRGLILMSRSAAGLNW